MVGNSNFTTYISTYLPTIIFPTTYKDKLILGDWDTVKARYVSKYSL